MIKLAHGCIDCGYAQHAVALQFDHIGDDKKMNVSDMIRSDYSWITILEEIRKCEVRCANCHAVMTQVRKHSILAPFRQPSYEENDSLPEAIDSADEVWTVLLASSGSLG